MKREMDEEAARQNAVRQWSDHPCGAGTGDEHTLDYFLEVERLRYEAQPCQRSLFRLGYDCLMAMVEAEPTASDQTVREGLQWARGARCSRRSALTGLRSVRGDRAFQDRLVVPGRALVQALQACSAGTSSACGRR
jgi:hypothetical protein